VKKPASNGSEIGGAETNRGTDLFRERLKGEIVEARLPLFDDVGLKLTANPLTGNNFATGRLQKGWLLCKGGEELSEESVGFGVPLIQRGLTTVFPGRAELELRRDGRGLGVDAVFYLNLEERIGGRTLKLIRSNFFLTLKKRLAHLYRSAPPLRSGMTAVSSLLQQLLRMETVYERIEPAAAVCIRYRLSGRGGRLAVAADFGFLGDATEAILMNEQGGRAFDEYMDTGGVRLSGKRIGGWDPIAADAATFLSRRHGLGFSLRRLPGSRLYRGREYVGARLAWSGFGYVLPPDTGRFEYDISIGIPE
jgi:hypothetical protein